MTRRAPKRRSFLILAAAASVVLATETEASALPTAVRRATSRPVTIVLSVNEHSTINGKRYRYNKRSNFIVHVGEHLSYDAGAFDDATKKPFAVEAMAFTLIASARTIPMPAKPYMKGFWTGHSRSRRD